MRTIIETPWYTYEDGNSIRFENGDLVRARPKVGEDLVLMQVTNVLITVDSGVELEQRIQLSEVR